MRTFIRVLFITLLASPLTVLAEETKATPTEETKKDARKKAEKLSADDLQIMAHYRAVNDMEIDLGKAAQKKASSQAVRNYGEMLVMHHSENNKKLMALAKQTGQKIPAHKPETEAEKQEMAESKKNAAALKKLEGADFEREYLRMMVADHDRELAKIDSKIADAKNSQLADLLRATKPVLQQHADQARELQKTNAQARR